MRMRGWIVVLSFAVAGAVAPVVLAETPAAGAAVRVPPPTILVAGVPPGSPVAKRIIEQAWRNALEAHGSSDLTDAEWQEVIAAIDAALADAGHPDAHAFRSSQLAAFSVSPAGVVAVAPSAGGAASTAPSAGVLPPVSERDSESGSNQRIAVRGFVVHGVGNHPKAGITPEGIQHLADAQLAKLGGAAGQPARLDFEQLQDVADAITHRYRTAGFIVANAYLPAQTVGDDERVRIEVLEGEIGKVVVKGTRHYRPWVVAAPAEKLRGQALQKRDVDSALLYARDLPGVSVSSTFQPGEEVGQTDLIMVAREAKHPWSVSLGANNYGTPVTGRYRAQAGFNWNDPLGIGDKLAVAIDYAFDPHQNTYGSLAYTVPTVKVRGLGVAVGADRSELELNSGPFAALDVRGPTSRWFGGLDWKFMNFTDLSMSSSLQFIHERSSLSSLGFQLSDERFDVAQLGFAMQHTDRRFHGLDMLSAAVRRALADHSTSPDLVSPNHAHHFTLARFDYTRIQFLAPTQQLFFKFSGQFTNDALVPMEQFAIGGPDSVRALPIAQSLSDRGYYSSLEYHVDAPGFADKPSPFGGAPWREVLTFEGFVDFARGYPAGANRSHGGVASMPIVTYRGAGLGLIFRLPRWHDLLFHLDGAVPVGAQQGSDKHDYQIYGRIGLTF